MVSITFDTLSAARRLREHGVPQEQAEAFADELRGTSQVDIDHLSTKEELSIFKSDMKADFALMRAEMRESEVRLKSGIKDLLIRLGGMIMALGGILIAIRYFG